MNSKLPPRDLSTMTEAIALTSPSGRMSKRARKAAEERIRRELFGDGLPHPQVKQPSKKESLLHQAKVLREFAALHPRKYIKEAERLEALAATMDDET